MIKFEFGSVDEMEKTLVALGRLVGGCNTRPVYMVPAQGTEWPCPEPVEAVSTPAVNLDTFDSATYEPAPTACTTPTETPTQNVIETTTITLPDAPAQNEPKAKRTRKPKVAEPEVIETPTQTVTEPEVIETPTQPEPEATKQPESTVTSEKSTVDSTLDHSDLRIRCVQVNDLLSEKMDPTKALDKVYGVLAKYNAKAAANVPDDQIAQCYADLDALLKAPVDA